MVGQAGIGLIALALRRAAQQAPAPAPKASISGSVTSARTGQPVKYATVVLGNAESGEITRETGRDGRFTFLGVEPGTYSISGGAQGYIWQEYGARRPGGHGIRITMTEGEPAASINFRLTPHGGIAGRVTDEDGEPLTGVGIEALRYRFDSDTRRRELTPAGSDLRKPYDSARSRGRC